MSEEINEWQRGNTVFIAYVFRNEGGVATDPSVGSTELAFFEGENEDVPLFVVPEASLTKLGTGNFKYSWVATANGRYTYRWYGIVEGKSHTFRRHVDIVEV